MFSIQVFVVVALVLSLACSCTAHSSRHTHERLLDSEYSFKLVLRDDDTGTYTLHWQFDLKAETIAFAVNVSTTGWVGFGLSPNGGMVNSDIVIGWVKDDQVYFSVSENLKITLALLSGRTNIKMDTGYRC